MGFLLLVGLLAATTLADIPTGITTQAAFETNGKNHFNRPIWLGEIPDRPGAFLVAEHHTGNIYVLSPAAQGYGKALFLKVAVSAMNEQGLLSMAFHPDFARNRKYYVHYSSPAAPRHITVEERETTADGLKDAGKAPRTVIEVPQEAGKVIHNGGNFSFGPDGMAYLSVGDGGTSSQAQARGDLMGNFLRLKIEPGSAAPGYQVPTDNPFVGQPGVRPEIWVYGLRNPWRMSWDMTAGDLWVGDVCQSAWEEVSLVRKGENLGWNVMEGTHGNSQPSYTPPVKDLPRDQARCIVGGMVFRGDRAAAFYGVYIFADHITNNLFGLTHANRIATGFATLGTAPVQPMSFASDRMGNLFLALGNGEIHKLVHAELKPSAQPMAVHPGPILRESAAPVLQVSISGTGYIAGPAAAGIESWEMRRPDGSLVASAETTTTIRIEGALPGLYLVRARTKAGWRIGTVWLRG